MKLICAKCGYVYDVGPSNDGKTDPACPHDPPGILRPPTATELVLVERYAALHKLYRRRGAEMRKLKATQGSAA